MKQLFYSTLGIAGLTAAIVSIKIYTPRAFDPNSASWQHTLEVHSGNAHTSLQSECEAYQLLVEKALIYRSNTIALADKLTSKSRTFTGSDLDALNEGTYLHLKLRDELMHIALAHESWLNAPQSLLSEHSITPELRLKGMMLSISASLLLYDNYLLAISVYEENEKLRRFINQEDRGYKINSDKLAEITLSYNSASKRERLRRAIRSYEEEMGTAPIHFRTDKQVAYLDLLIRSSPSYAMIRDYAPIRVAASKLSFLEAITTDKLKELSREGISIFSMLFGNTMGLVETRKGKLYNSPQAISFISSQLKPGDILLEKTPFRLTDKLIPGHWGHAAIWIGTESEIRDLGIWEHEAVVPYHSMIREKRLVVEALRSGVELNPLEHFLNVDDIAILRDPSALKSKEAHADRIILALRQVGKPYDFNFDVETTDRIVCSELCYVVCTNIDWPTDKKLGRATISPDNVASKTFDGLLDLVLFYHDGNLVEQNPVAKMATLMQL